MRNPYLFTIMHQVDPTIPVDDAIGVVQQQLSRRLAKGIVREKFAKACEIEKNDDGDLFKLSLLVMTKDEFLEWRLDYKHDVIKEFLRTEEDFLKKELAKAKEQQP